LKITLTGLKPCQGYFQSTLKMLLDNIPVTAFHLSSYHQYLVFAAIKQDLTQRLIFSLSE